MPVSMNSLDNSVSVRSCIAISARPLGVTSPNF
jgi:hypothetical protein